MEINLGDLGISPAMLARIQAGGGIMGNAKPKRKKKAVAKKAKPGVKLRRGKPVASKSPSTGRKGVNPLAGINIEELMNDIGGEGGGVGNYYRGANPVPTPPKPSASGAAPGVMRQLKDLFGGADPIKTSQFPTGEPANMLEFADVPAGAFKLGGGGGSGGILPRASSGTTDTPYSINLRPGDEGFDYASSTEAFGAPRDFTVGAEGNLDDLRREYESLVNAQIGDDSGILPKDELGRPDKDALARRSSRLGELAVGIYNQDSSFESPYMNNFDEIGRVRGQVAPGESYLGGRFDDKGRKMLENDAAKYAEARARNDGSFNQEPPPPPPPPPPSAQEARDSFTPRNIMGPSYNPADREAYAAKVQAQRDAMKPGGNIKSQYPTAMNPMSAMPQTQFGGYGAQMPMQALNPYAGMATPNEKVDFFPNTPKPPATGMAPQPKIT